MERDNSLEESNIIKIKKKKKKGLPLLETDDWRVVRQTMTLPESFPPLNELHQFI